MVELLFLQFLLGIALIGNGIFCMADATLVLVRLCLQLLKSSFCVTLDMHDVMLLLTYGLDGAHAHKVMVLTHLI